jgi:Ca2+-binding RTX toxin-like protein
MRSLVCTLVIAPLLLTGAVAAGPALATETTCNGLTATIVGTEGNDTLTGTEGPDVIAGLGGSDTIDALGGDDVVCGGDEPASLDWVLGDRIDGGAGADLIRGGAGADHLVGGDGADDLRGGPDFVYGGDQNLPDIWLGDVLEGGSGDDRLDAGYDVRNGDRRDRVDVNVRDVLSFASAPGGVKVDLVAGTATGDGADTVVRTRLQVVGSRFADRLYGGPLPDRISGEDGFDIVRGRGGDDLLFAEWDAQTRPEPTYQLDGGYLYGGDGNDRLQARGRGAVLYGGDGRDLLRILRSGPGQLYGGSGPDTLVAPLGVFRHNLRGEAGRDTYVATYVGTAPGRVHVDLARGRSNVGDLSWASTGLEDVVAYVPAITVRGTAGPNHVFASNDGTVRFYGRAGDDRLRRSANTDWFDGGSGRDRIYGPHTGPRDACISVEVKSAPCPRP